MSLKIGIAGTGWFGMMHAEKLSKIEGVEVSAFSATSLQKAEAAASKFDRAKGYASITDMLDGDKLDAVYICVPPFAHGAIELALVQRGIPFLVEKPIGVDLGTPFSILESVTSSGLITSVGYHFRYMDGTKKAKELLADRELAMALGYWMGGMPGVNWWRSMQGSGGQFVEQTTHIVDLLRYVAGEVKEVYAAYGSRVMAGKEDNVTVPDVGSVTMKLESGAIATISNTCAIPAGDRSGLHIYTDKGVLEIGHAGLTDIAAGIRTEYGNQNNPYDEENKAFLHAVRTGDASLIASTYEDAWKTHRVTMAANISAQSGKAVAISELEQ